MNQCKADLAQAESDSRSLKENLAKQEYEVKRTEGVIHHDEINVSKALNKADMEQARETLAQAQQDHEAAIKLKDNLESALKIKPYEIQKASELVRSAYKATWQAKLDELIPQIRLQRDLIGACVAANKQAGGPEIWDISCNK